MTAIDASLPKKERILIAAEDVFSRRGYTKATLDEIIALADTGKGTLYKYFGNKDNLFYTLIEEKHSHLMDELHSLTAQQPDIRGKLQAYLNCMLKFLRTNKRPVADCMVRAQRSAPGQYTPILTKTATGY